MQDNLTFKEAFQLIEQIVDKFSPNDEEGREKKIKALSIFTQMYDMATDYLKVDPDATHDDLLSSFPITGPGNTIQPITSISGNFSLTLGDLGMNQSMFVELSKIYDRFPHRFHHTPRLMEVEGDLLSLMDEKDLLDAMGHGCNLMSKFGAFAKFVVKKYPELVFADREFHEIREGIDKKHLVGEISGAETDQMFQSVFNLYTQLRPGPNFNLAGLGKAVHTIFDSVYNISGHEEMFVLGVPYIGLGVGFAPDLLNPDKPAMYQSIIATYKGILDEFPLGVIIIVDYHKDPQRLWKTLSKQSNNTETS